MAIYTVYSNASVGCYGTDYYGNHWSTFGLMGENNTVKCADCGKTITGGWSMGMLGDEVYYCSEHVNYIHEGSPKRFKVMVEGEHIFVIKMFGTPQERDAIYFPLSIAGMWLALEWMWFVEYDNIPVMQKVN